MQEDVNGTAVRTMFGCFYFFVDIACDSFDGLDIINDSRCELLGRVYVAVNMVDGLVYYHHVTLDVVSELLYRLYVAIDTARELLGHFDILATSWTTSLIVATLLSTLCVTSRFLADVISPSSLVRVSKRRSACSTSVLPTGHFTNLAF